MKKALKPTKPTKQVSKTRIRILILVAVATLAVISSCYYWSSLRDKEVTFQIDKLLSKDTREAFKAAISIKEFAKDSVFSNLVLENRIDDLTGILEHADSDTKTVLVETFSIMAEKELFGISDDSYFKLVNNAGKKNPFDRKTEAFLLEALQNERVKPSSEGAFMLSYIAGLLNNNKYQSDLGATKRVTYQPNYAVIIPALKEKFVKTEDKNTKMHIIDAIYRYAGDNNDVQNLPERTVNDGKDFIEAGAPAVMKIEAKDIIPAQPIRTPANLYEPDCNAFPITEVWVDKEYNINRSAIVNDTGKATNWIILKDGEEVLERNAKNETQFKYSDDPGIYTVYVNQFVGGSYRVISNVITFEIE